MVVLAKTVTQKAYVLLDEGLLPCSLLLETQAVEHVCDQAVEKFERVAVLLLYPSLAQRTISQLYPESQA
jgi:hypothetical protein